MPSYKLVYFNIKGRAEAARYMFAIAGVKYEDKRVTGEEWAALKPKTTLGQIPILYVDDKELPQNRAIKRYLAGELGLYGSNSWDKARIDVVCETVNEITNGVAGIFAEQDEAKKDELRKKFVSEVVTKLLENLDKLLKLNNNGEGWFVGDKISVADVSVYSALADFLPFLTKCEELDFTSRDALKGLLSRVKSHPKIAEWIKNRPTDSM